jgi:hypothetical protein
LQNLKISIATIAAVFAIVILNFFMPAKDITAQGPPYLKVKTIQVPSSNNATGRVFCENGDGIISGGYSIGFHSKNSPFNTMMYSNHPLQKVNKTGYFEGWEAGLVNKGNETVTLTATTLCLNLKLTP